MTEERTEVLMVRVVDGIATAAEREELMAYITDKPDLKQELEMHEALKAVTDGWVQRLELDLAEDRHNGQGLTRLWEMVGWTLLLVGTTILGGFGLAELLTAPDVPFWIKAGYTSLSAGFVVLFAAVIRWRLTVGKHDKYTEVVR
jgi:hypothetical protein